MANALLQGNGQRVIDSLAIDSAPRSYNEVKKQRRIFGWFHKFCRS
jgi:hypothetical protein